MKKILLNRKTLCFTAAAIFLFSIVVAVILINDFEKVELVGTFGRDFEKAVVTEIIKDNLQEDGQRYGNQEVKVKIIKGEHKGKELDAASLRGNLFGADCRVGMHVVVIVSESGDNLVTTVYSQDRSYAVYGFAIFFILLLGIIGGKKGAKATVSLLFTLFSIFMIMFPLMYRGVSPVLASVTIAVLTTFFTITFVCGISLKSLAAILGTVFGVIAAVAAAVLFGIIAGIDGYNVSNIESLVYITEYTNVHIGELLFAGILISSLGAVMDVGMSISSAIVEIKEKSPDISHYELFSSGMNVGRDMMGTMSNTLILAFVGGSLSTLILDYVYDLSYIQLINSYNIGIEIMQGVSGSIGVVLTVPFVAFFASFLSNRIRN